MWCGCNSRGDGYSRAQNLIENVYNSSRDVNLKQPAGLQIASSVVLWGLGAPLPHRLSSLQCFWAKLRKMSSAATYARNPAPDMTTITKAMR